MPPLVYQTIEVVRRMRKNQTNWFIHLQQNAILNWRAVCGESRTHGSEGAVKGRPFTATLQSPEEQTLG